MVDENLPPPALRPFILIAVMSATLMQVLDTTIANVALPHMQAALGANQETISWVLTSYILVSAIATPTTGWLESRFGRRNLFVASVTGFTLASALCGVANSLTMMVLARAAQGMFGAFLLPLGQTVMLDSFPKEKQAQSMLIWSLGVMVGPIIGPVMGGILTDSYNWRWVFYINLPIGIASATALWFLLDPRRITPRRFDLLGFILLAITLAAFQLMLDRGTHRDWFNSTEIIIEAAVAATGLWMFVVHSLTTPDPLIPLTIFRDRNFVLANMFILVTSSALYAGAALIAPFMQVLLGYDTTTAGMMMMPRGIAMSMTMLLAGRFALRVDTRFLIGGGLIFLAVSQWMMTGFDLMMDQDLIIWSGVVQGVGMGMAVFPLNALVFSTLPPALRPDGASFFNLTRATGASIAIAVASALLAMNIQVSHSELGAHVTDSTIPLLDERIVVALGQAGASIGALLDAEINRQAAMIAYVNDFWVLMWAAIIALPLTLLLRGVKVVN